MVSIPLSDKQLLSLRESVARVNLWEGSIRSGKTTVSLLRFLIAVANADNSGEIVIMGRTRDSLYRNVLLPMMNEDIFGTVARRVLYNNGASTANILGRIVHVIGASDAKTEAVVRGMTVQLWYGDELTVLPEGTVVQMLARMSSRNAKAFLTTNTEGPRHWLKLKFVDRAAELGWKIWSFRLPDNPSLPAEYLTAIKSELTGVWYARYIEGKWAMADGLVYDTLDLEENTMTPPSDAHILKRVVGVDYGTTNATAAVMLAIASDRKMYVLDEWRHDTRVGQPSWTDAQLSSGMRVWLDRHPPVDWVAVDPSAASFIRQLWADGFSNVTRADNAVVDGLRSVSSLLRLRSLQIVHAPALLDEMAEYSWDTKAAERGDDAPDKDTNRDHSCDALRYAVRLALSLYGHLIERGLSNVAA